MQSNARLPYCFEAKRLVAELEYCHLHWTRHFNTAYYSGEWSGISIRFPEGEHHPLSAGHAGDDIKFVDSPVMEQLPYTQSVIDSIKVPKFGIRYLRLTPGSVIKPHKDYDIVFWDGMVRLHIPIVTNDQVKFIVDDQTISMKEGECWFADFSKIHSVENHGTTDRIHLVIDCQVNDWLTRLFEKVGIINPGENAPGELDNYDENDQKRIISELEKQGTTIALDMAEKMKRSMQNKQSDSE